MPEGGPWRDWCREIITAARENGSMKRAWPQLQRPRLLAPCQINFKSGIQLRLQHRTTDWKFPPAIGRALVTDVLLSQPCLPVQPTSVCGKHRPVTCLRSNPICTSRSLLTPSPILHNTTAVDFWPRVDKAGYALVNRIQDCRRDDKTRILVRFLFCHCSNLPMTWRHDQRKTFSIVRHSDSESPL